MHSCLGFFGVLFMYENLQPELIWFILGFILLLGELVIPSFILIFFGIGAWFTTLAVFIGFAPNINIQLLVFMAFSILTLLLFRKKSLENSPKLKHRKVIEDISSVVGEHVLVLEDLTPHVTGKVELHGTSWQAISDVPVKKGIEVVVVEQDNLTLKVKPFN
jgi:membrane protein implicated in regulation of membrane protease activity